MPERVVLLVEDNPGDVWMMEQAFSEVGMPARLVVLGDGEKAAAYLARRPP